MSQDGRGEYEVTCICGQTTRSNTVEFTCSKCGRQIELRWPAEYRQPTPPASILASE